MRSSGLIKVLCFSLPLLASCSTSQVADYATRTALREIGVDNNLISLGMDLQKDVLGFEALIRLLAQNIKVNWGDEKTASRTEYVKYTNDYRTRVLVDFERGKVHVETLDRPDLRHAIIVTLLTPHDPDSVDLFSDRDIVLGEEPMLYRQVLDHNNHSIRWEWRAERFADYLISNKLEQRSTEKGLVYSVDIDLVSDHITQRQYQYAHLVRQYSRKYDVKESLIYAIMRTESSFNPYAISHANAYGLMQIIPSTAGRDVFERVKNKPGQPSRDYLFQPHQNIDVGTAYLSLLDNHYLSRIRDPLTRKYTVISAYNGGAGNVFRTFDSNRDRAIAKINDLQPAQVYWALTQRHPLSESRRYLEKVTEAERDFYRGDV